MTSFSDTEKLPPLIDFSDVIPTPSPDFIEDSEPEPDAEFIGDDAAYDTPTVDFVEAPKRSRKAVEYERKTASWFNGMFRAAIGNPATVPDAAAITMHAKPISTAVGDLAAADPRVERAINFISSGTSNPYAAVAFATMPLVMQLIRNHGLPFLKPVELKIRVPFGKRRGEVWRSLTVDLRNFTNDPDALAEYVFSNPQVLAALEKQGLTVAHNGTAGR